MEQNLLRFVFSRAITEKRCAWVIMIDDVKADERPGYNVSDDGAGGRGWCREHTRLAWTSQATEMC